MSSLLSTRDVARRFDVSSTTVARWVANGSLPAYSKLPGRTGAFVFRAEDVDAYARGERPITETCEVAK